MKNVFCFIVIQVLFTFSAQASNCILLCNRSTGLELYCDGNDKSSTLEDQDTSAQAVTSALNALQAQQFKVVGQSAMTNAAGIEELWWTLTK
ncbi:MAG: hypothetical protein C5B49_07965 [Bdellovibrio sp.]|nr:MAG: hypothetical protein C5B49_07965 [Bdellovibrio sp.]